MTDTANWLDRYQPWRRSAEIGFWVVAFLVNAVFNSLTVLMDVQRARLDFAPWKPAVWETSSGLLILLLVPTVVWFTRRFPLHRDTWRRHLPWYLPASVVWSLAHVAGMVALRKLAYASQGEHYDFGNWPLEFGYEYLKDVRGFVSTVALIHAYRFVLLRLQGEASLLTEPDVGPPVDPVERPERFLVRKLGREFLIAAEDIEWIQAAGNYANLRVRGRDYPLRSTIAGIEARLDPQRFARVHRSYLINLDQLAMIEPLDTGDARLHLKDGTTLPCSRRYRNGLRGRAAGAA
ncbi:MAG: LytTR family transcriptional regulator [Lysobacterales bacterium 69-70]|nr:LytTR family transcriptional regulator [Xanthomonadaceae bacterium]ODU34000.1 MAG: LytTR family transcriptional regulator [Xanthomonadaceae bacterium SCN 69-320]ODV18696.1 MAG: LytTR family transcriptional regulator [Xanthomonadaceae bacterium SCN 69-25]OJY93101.1 MAG: LytTR family transcriptional regulator [Xanthomonadales bacterium 69-70]